MPLKHPKTGKLREKAKQVNRLYAEVVNRGLLRPVVVKALAKARPGRFRTKRVVVEAWLRNRQWNKQHKELPISPASIIRAGEFVSYSPGRGVSVRHFSTEVLSERPARKPAEVMVKHSITNFPKSWDLTQSGSFVAHLLLKSCWGRKVWVEFRLNANGGVDESMIIDFGLVDRLSGKRTESFFTGKEKEAVEEITKLLGEQLRQQERELEH